MIGNHKSHMIFVKFDAGILNGIYELTLWK